MAAPAGRWLATLDIGAGPDEKNQVWMMFMILHPQDPKQLFVGGTRLWRSVDDGDNWAALSGELRWQRHQRTGDRPR